MKVIKLFKLPFKYAGFKLFYTFGWPILKPLSVAIYVTDVCNSKCKTCNIWKQKPGDILNIQEWKKIIKSIGKTPLWYTVTGGEPFLQKNIDKIIYLICKYAKPLFINIPTNALLSEAIKEKLPLMLQACQKSGTILTLNMSIDALGKEYDAIRGVKNGIKQISKTISMLKQLQKQFNNLNIGVNITISKYNVESFKEIYLEIQTHFKPDSIVAEVATMRKTFFLTEDSFIPQKNANLFVLQFLSNQKESKNNLAAKITQTMRRGYYKHAKWILEKQKTNLPCKSLLASVEILSDGDVVNCCALGESIGNLRDSNYSFDTLWKSTKASKLRKKIKQTKCSCTLTNPYYTNRLLK